MAKKPTRLRFTEDDLTDKAVRQAADRAEKAVGKAEKAVEKASKPKKKLRTEERPLSGMPQLWWRIPEREIPTSSGCQCSIRS